MPESSSRKTSRRWLPLGLSAALALGAAGLGACQPARPQGPPQEAPVARVVDGDTLVLANQARVRLLGIDAPEMEKEGEPAQFLAHKSKQALAELTRGRKVRLEYDELRYDHYGRLLAYLFTPEGVNISLEMVRQGLAHVYTTPPNLHYRTELVAAQQEAIRARRGVWVKALSQDEPRYVANCATYRFHRPGCHLGQSISPANRLIFSSLTEAYWQGFSPCRSCKP